MDRAAIPFQAGVSTSWARGALRQFGADRSGATLRRVSARRNLETVSGRHDLRGLSALGPRRDLADGLHRILLGHARPLVDAARAGRALCRDRTVPASALHEKRFAVERSDIVSFERCGPRLDSTGQAEHTRMGTHDVETQTDGSERRVRNRRALAARPRSGPRTGAGRRYRRCRSNRH